MWNIGSDLSQLATPWMLDASHFSEGWASSQNLAKNKIVFHDFDVIKEPTSNPTVSTN